MSENHLRAGNIELVLQGLFLQSRLEDSDKGRTKMDCETNGYAEKKSISPLIFRIQPMVGHK